MLNIQQSLNDQLATGTILPRKDFPFLCENAKYKERTVLLSTNYRCLDGYSETQRVEHLGTMVTVFDNNGKSECVVVEKGQALDVEGIYDALLKRCHHKHSRELSWDECKQRRISHFGQCWHAYECQDCKVVFAHDTSD